MGTRLHCWYTLHESRWAVNWETVNWTWWGSSLKGVKGNSQEKAGRRATSWPQWILGKESGKSKEGWGCSKLYFFLNVAAWRAQAVAESHREPSRLGESCEWCSRVEEKPWSRCKTLCCHSRWTLGSPRWCSVDLLLPSHSRSYHRELWSWKVTRKDPCWLRGYK